MTPTNKLRFVQRDLYRYENPEGTVTAAQTIRVLQQWWENFSMTKQEFVGEWRDVPLEVEHANG